MARAMASAVYLTERPAGSRVVWFLSGIQYTPGRNSTSTMANESSNEAPNSMASLVSVHAHELDQPQVQLLGLLGSCSHDVWFHDDVGDTNTSASVELTLSRLL